MGAVRGVLRPTAPRLRIKTTQNPTTSARDSRPAVYPLMTEVIPTTLRIDWVDERTFAGRNPVGAPMGDGGGPGGAAANSAAPSHQNNSEPHNVRSGLKASRVSLDD